MIRTIVKLIILAVIVNAAVNVVPVFWADFRFKDAVKELARFSAKLDDKKIAGEVMDIAVRMEVPLAAQDVRVSRLGQARGNRDQLSRRDGVLPAAVLRPRLRHARRRRAGTLRRHHALTAARTCAALRAAASDAAATPAAICGLRAASPSPGRLISTFSLAPSQRRHEQARADEHVARRRGFAVAATARPPTTRRRRPA